MKISTDILALKYRVFTLALFATLLLICACSSEEAVPVAVNFSIEVVNNDFSVPVRVALTNTTQGADTYNWEFEGASPSNSTVRNPGTITYADAGSYIIKLNASNQDGITATKEITLTLDSEITIGFTKEIQVNNFPPVEVAITNTTVGAESYLWTFAGGSPSNTTEQHPANVVFNDPGEHTITLQVSNGLETYKTEQIVTVAPHLTAAFDFDVAFADDDYQAPVTFTMLNNSISATSYTWTFTGGLPASGNDENPTVTFNNPGTYMLELQTANGKDTQSAVRPVTILPDTNIRSFQDLQLGINTAHSSNTLGAFFSTITREIYKKDEVTDTNGQSIDIVLYGLNENFTFNKFVSPDEVHNFTFDAITNATHTKFINLQESCACGALMTTAEFDNMADDTQLSALTITETTAGLQEFDDSVVPRIVLFETEDGRKGAIKIKEFVMNGTNSYVVVDIKVQKQ